MPLLKKNILIQTVMKKVIVFICVIAVAVTLNSCKKAVYYGCCDAGHLHWETGKYESPDAANISAAISDHNSVVHGGVSTAQICNAVVKR